MYTEKICLLKSHRLCVILVDRLESRLNIMNLLIEEYDNRLKYVQKLRTISILNFKSERYKVFLIIAENVKRKFESLSDSRGKFKTPWVLFSLNQASKV